MSRTMFSFQYLSLYYVFICALGCFNSVNSLQVDDVEMQMTFNVEHSFFSTGDNFKPRGVLNVKSVRSGIAGFVKENSIDEKDNADLQELVQSNGFYRIKVFAKSADQSYYVSSFIKACSLYESKLSDILTLNTDQAGSLLGVSISTMQPQCQGLRFDDQFSSFNTTVILAMTEPGPVPDTQAYVQKLEQENHAKAKGEQPDNRSFFAKYTWSWKTKILEDQSYTPILSHTDVWPSDCFDPYCNAFATIGFNDESKPVYTDIDNIICGSHASDMLLDPNIGDTLQISNDKAFCGINQVVTAILDTSRYWLIPDYFKCLQLVNYKVDYSKCQDLEAEEEIVFSCPQSLTEMYYIVGMWRKSGTTKGISGLRCCVITK